jgi:hypothetical protein
VLAVLEMGWWPRGARLCALVLGVALAVPGLTRADQCVACEADVAAGRRDFSDEQWAAMQRGEVVSSHQDTSASTESENQLIEASAIVPRPPALVWSVITDFDGRPKFMGNVKAAHVVRTEGNRVWVSEKLKVCSTGSSTRARTTTSPSRSGLGSSTHWTTGSARYCSIDPTWIRAGPYPDSSSRS